MRKILAAAVFGLVAIAAAYLTGYSQEHRPRLQAEARAAALQAQLAAVEARVRTGEILGRALTLKEVTMRQNYGQAQELSSGFFDAVRAEAMASTDAVLRDALTQTLANRDAVTVSLATGSPTAVEALHDIEVRLRRALGYTLPPDPVATP